ncbi:MAG: DUF167 domain-containing protein [Geminicoccaceae bacterium]|nr:DUF167 domain-containing protein [Geminicoccaceae bacterium]
MGAWRLLADGVEVALKVTPRAARPGLGGVEAGAWLKAKVAEPPADGAANAGVTRLLAKALGVPPSRVSLVQGATGRKKRFRIEGEPGRLAALLEIIARASGREA